MPLFESYDRRIKQINEALAKYGIGPGMAGAITIYGSFKLVQTGDVLFENNVTDKNTAGISPVPQIKKVAVF